MGRLERYGKEVVILASALDDDSQELEMIKDLLTEEGFTNFKFFTHIDDFRLNLTEHVHLVILDHHLGGAMTGLDVMREVRKLNPDAYVIAFTGITDCDIAIEYTNQGVNKICDKNKRGYQKKLVGFVREGLEFIKDQFDFYGNLMNRIHDAEERLAKCNLK